MAVEARSTNCGAAPPVSQAPSAEPQGLGTAAPLSVIGAREWLLSATSTGSNSLRKYGPGGTRTDIVTPPARTTAATGGPIAGAPENGSIKTRAAAHSSVSAMSATGI